jgi:hypothetical protein
MNEIVSLSERRHHQIGRRRILVPWQLTSGPPPAAQSPHTVWFYCLITIALPHPAAEAAAVRRLPGASRAAVQRSV